MITSRQEFFRLLLEGKALTKKDEEIDGIKYLLYYTIEEACEWLFNESMNYDKWEVLENE